MWGAPEEPPDGTEGAAAGPLQPTQIQPANVKDICEDNKSQLETFKDIMLKNKNELKRKEEELQEYASKLSEIKSRAKLSRRSKDGSRPGQNTALDGSSSSVESTPKTRVESIRPEDDTVVDISQAKTPKAKSSLLQRKLAENRKVFEKRSKEMTASKRAVEEKVEAIRQQMDQTDMTLVEAQRDSLIVNPVRPVLVTQIAQPVALQLGHLQDKDNKIAELNNRILELEAAVIDLQDNLKEKDSVIESKTRAVTLMSADLSKKGKTTLDTLEDTKDEMRTMQQNFVLLETSLKGKNENLLEQLQERNNKVAELETTISRYEQEIEEKRLADTASANMSRTTIDMLADTKDAMRSMQENFVLIETSLKDKVDNLLQQLEDRETKLAEAEEKIYKLESGAGVTTAPEIPELRYRIDRLEQSNRTLQDEKYELQKSIVELQEKIVAREATNGNGLVIEKDNRIAELENLIEELKSSNQLLEEESKAELQKQVVELAASNDEFRSKINDLEILNNDLETRMNELRAKLPDESGATKEDAMVRKLTKELDDLNKSMIKLKAQHKGKLRNLQRQLESFKTVSDANAELVKLGNQVALLEEEKGNLQLSLVDFDELKASTGDWQDRIASLESRVSTQANDIQAHIEAIAILENQKLDLMQELHSVKQEISSLEAENAESENLRVTAEMKVVDLEEQLESLHKSHKEQTWAKYSSDKEAESSKPPIESEELLNKIEHLTQENSELIQKVAKLEEKPSSEAGSTESFETIHEDRNEMLRRIETLSSRNSELEEKCAKLEEGTRSTVGSTESFETINDTDKSELLKKIDFLSRENNDLVTKLNKFEEKGSSDTGSTESFEKISEHGESLSRIQVLTRENNELVIKLTKLEEKYENLESRLSEAPRGELRDENSEIEQKLDNLTRENNDLVIELTKVQEKLSRVSEEKVSLEKYLEESQATNVRTSEEVAQHSRAEDELKSRIESLSAENSELMIKLAEAEENNSELKNNQLNLVEAADKIRDTATATNFTVAGLEAEIMKCRLLITEQTEITEELKLKLAEKDTELEAKIQQINEYEAAGISVEQLQRELKESFNVVDEWKFKCTEMERKMEILEAGKTSIEKGLEILQNENEVLTEQFNQRAEAVEALKQELDRANITAQEEIRSLKEIVETKDRELHEKYLLLQNEMINIDALQDELNACKIQLQQNETTIVSLNEEIARLGSVVRLSNEETISAQAEVDALREELQSKAAKEAKNEELSVLLSDKESLAEEMRTILNEQLKENAELRNIIENANAEVAKLRAVLAEKEAEAGALEAAKTALDKELRKVEAARAEIEERLNVSEDKVEHYKVNIDDFTMALENATKNFEQVTEELKSVKSNYESLAAEMEDKNKEYEAVDMELKKKTKLLEDLEQKSSELETLRGLLAEKEKIISQNVVTAEAKVAFELRIKELEEKIEKSEANTQAQLQKRKILAANLKKKSSEVAEHEAKAVQLEAKAAAYEAKLRELEPRAAEYVSRVEELEEKWMFEKQEKDAANLRIQDIETVVEDRNRAILQLEEQLHRSLREATSASERADDLSSQLDNSAEKINALVEQVTEMGEEIEKLRTEIEIKASEIESERAEKCRIIVEFDSCKQKIVDEEIQRQQVLEEAKEKARELGVRMQVMETEYVDQLNTIQTLRTENGMLVSKQAQISERLENAEKEAAERKILLDQLQRETAARDTTSVQQQEPPSAEDDHPDLEGKAGQPSQPCDHCDQCQTVVQALEAKLQERDAEIENLDNELANSIGNFVHMRESLRVSDLMNQSSSRNRNLEDARDNNDLVFQYNVLTASNTEIREQLNATILENQELKEKIASLQALNGALQERTGAVEEELIEGREATTRIHAVDALHTELADKCRLRESELQDARSELEVTKQRHEEWMAGMRSQVEQLESENRLLTSKCETLVQTNDIAEGEVLSLRQELDRSEQRVLEMEKEVQKYRQEVERLSEEAMKSSEKSTSASAFFGDKDDDGPQLFDAAKVFGLSPALDRNGQREIADLRNIVAMRDAERTQLSEEVRRLEEQLASQQSLGEQMNDDRQRLQNEVTRLEQLLAERNRQIDALNSELNNVGVQLAAQFDQQGNTDRLESVMAKLRTELEEQSGRLCDSEVAVENLTAFNTELAAQLQNLQAENVQYSKAIDVVSSVLQNLGELEANKISETVIDAAWPAIKEKLDEIAHSLVGLKEERNDLLAQQEIFKLRIVSLESEIESSNDPSRVQELEERVDRITRERDIKQLQVNDLTRSLEEMQETVENASSNEVSRLRNLQAALDEALSEHDRLKVELEATKRAKEQVAPVKHIEDAEMQSAQSSQASGVEAPGVADVEAAWDDETKLDVDEEIWSWNPEDAQLANDHKLLAATPLQPSLEITLKTRIAELEDTIKDLEGEREKLVEEAKVAQVRSGKLLKKLKEFKIQNESLQQQLIIEKASSGFGDLDSAIEEELKSQIASLEKSLTEAKEDQKKIVAERDNLTKRIDVLTAANERLVEMKERQDMEVEVLQIRTKDLANKLQAVEWQFREACGDEPEIRALPVVEEQQLDVRQATHVQAAATASRASEGPAAPGALECLCNKYREELDELRDEMEALASENEQLQRLLEEQKNTRLSSETKFAEELSTRDKQLDDLLRRRTELEKDLEDARRDYTNLRDQCDRTAHNSDEQTSAIKTSHEMLKVEFAEKTNAFEAQVADMRREIEIAGSQINNLQEHLQTLAQEKQELVEKTISHEETKEKLQTLSDSMAEVTELLNARVQEVAELKQEMRKLKADKNEALDTVEGLAQNHYRELSEKQQEAQRYLHECEAQLADKSKEIKEFQEKLSESEAALATNAALLNEKVHEIITLQEKLSEADAERATNDVHVQNLRDEIERLNNALTESRLHRESLQSELAGKEQQAFNDEDEVRKYSIEIERLNELVGHMKKSSADTIDEANRKIREIEEREASLQQTIAELRARESDVLAQLYREINEKDGKVAMLEQTISNLEQKMHEVASGGAREKSHEPTVTADRIPVCRIIGDSSQELKIAVEQLTAELSRKNEEIEDYKYQLSENTYPSIIQALQDQVNQLYEEKAKLEEALNSMTESLNAEEARKEELAESLKQENQRQLEKQREIEELRRLISESKSDESARSIAKNKDMEIHNLKVEIEEKGVRFRELHDHYESAMVEINELQMHLATKEEEMRLLKTQLEATSKESELLQRAMKKEVPSNADPLQRSESSTTSIGDVTNEQSSNELDLALYMLHQRDVRVEELTHELMQLLEERDTLQLRLSNAIRITEELRRSLPTDATHSDNLRGSGDAEPIVEQPSPSKSVGPVEIAKEAIDSPSEEKVALAQNYQVLSCIPKPVACEERHRLFYKFVDLGYPNALDTLIAAGEKLSQLHNMGHRRDVRLMDDRELRHNQQMSLLAHRDVLNTLPPEAAARLVNANYTLSRDVQSQSSVLMNWLWGKSTPKVVHM